MPVVDISFPFLDQAAIPVDHGYLVFAALSRLMPDIRSDPEIGVHPIKGQLLGGRTLLLNQRSRLVIRAPHEAYPWILSLAGRALKLGSSEVRLGIPHVQPLEAAAALKSRLVIIKPYMEAEAFLTAAKRQLARLGVSAELSLVARPMNHSSLEGRSGSRSPFVRRTLKIRNHIVVGFAVNVHNLAPHDSLLLQARGLGGRRHMGCGIFVPASEASGQET